MRSIAITSLLTTGRFLALLSAALLSTPLFATDAPPVAIVLHGGAGTISQDKMTDEVEQQYMAIMDRVISQGHQALREGRDGVSVVVYAIKLMEDSPLFNAGIGAVYTFEAEHELDASIMHGKSRMAGAVAGVKHIKNPIELARLVMEQSPHVMLTGDGAEVFAEQQGIEKVNNAIFNTPRRLEALNKAKARIEAEQAMSTDELGRDMRFGTVGVVVLDAQGNIVAGTSTGGMTAKRFGRVGDSPIIGAGTFADNVSCGVSATGHGEYFIRYQVAFDICARMQYQGLSLAEAANKVINEVLVEAGGDGGVVALDAKGNVAMPFNTSGMYRASIDGSGLKTIKIFQD